MIFFQSPLINHQNRTTLAQCVRVCPVTSRIALRVSTISFE